MLIITDILNNKIDSLELRQHAVKVIQACGSFEYTKAKIEELCKELLAENDRLGGNPYLEAIVNNWNDMDKFGVF